MSDYSAPNKTPEVVALQLHHIAPSPLNPRKRTDREALHNLADDIRLNGVIQPITVRVARAGDVTEPALIDRPYVIVTGERRWRAAGLVPDMETIRAIIAPDMDDATHLRMAYSENAHRSDLSPIECAAAYDRMLLLEPALTQEALGKRLGVSQPVINNRLRLWRQLPLKIRDKVDAGIIPESHATELCRLSEYEPALLDMAERLEEEGWNLKHTRLRVAALLSQLDDEATARAAQVALPLEVATVTREVAKPAEASPAEGLTQEILESDGWKDGGVLEVPTPETHEVGPTGATVPIIYLVENTISSGCCHLVSRHHLTWLPGEQPTYFDTADHALAFARVRGAEPRVVVGRIPAEADLQAVWEEQQAPVSPPVSAPVAVEPERIERPDHDGLPDGQKSTWYQWCNGAQIDGNDPAHINGYAAGCYRSGMTGGQFRKKQETAAAAVAVLTKALDEEDAIKGAAETSGLTPSPKEVDTPDGHVQVTIPSDLDDWLWENNITADAAIALLRKLQPYSISPVSRQLVDAVIERVFEGQEKPTPSKWLDDYIAEFAAHTGIDVQAIEDWG